MPNNNSSNHNFLHTIASAPALYKWAGAALVIVLFAGYFTGGGGASNPRPSTTAPVHAAAAPAAAPAPAASTAQVQAGPLTLPAQTPPGAPLAGRAEIAMAGAALPPYGVTPIFQSLGRSRVGEHIASFTVDAPKPLTSVAPSAGLLRLRWHSWYRAVAAGSYTLVASIAGGDLRSITMRVDGQQAPVLQGTRAVCSAFTGCPPTATTVAGAVTLAAGWHSIEVEAVADATGAPRPTVTLFVRAPGADAPTALVPSWPAPLKPAASGAAP